MTLVGFPGSKRAYVGPTMWTNTNPARTFLPMDATNEAVIMIGYIETSDGGSHTIDTTGSSSIFWMAGAVTFADVGSTVKVGLAAVDTAVGPPARAVNSSDVITFDVSRTLIGGGGGIASLSAQNHVPDTGTKTVGNGDLVAVCMQMTARAGVDAVNVACALVASTAHRQLVTTYFAATYTPQLCLPNALITFSDGATGWFWGGEVFSTIATRIWNSGSATKEYGQLYSLPFPTTIYGLYTWIAPTADFELVLYSNPLGGSPAAERTVSIDANVTSTATGRYTSVLFPSPYTTTADQVIGAVLKPGPSNVTAYYKTFNAATQRVSEPWGTSGYGISRSAGAFTNANSSLDHYYIGLITGAFDVGGGAAGRAVQINNDSLVA